MDLADLMYICTLGLSVINTRLKLIHKTCLQSKISKKFRNSIKKIVNNYDLYYI